MLCESLAFKRILEPKERWLYRMFRKNETFKRHGLIAPMYLNKRLRKEVKDDMIIFPFIKPRREMMMNPSYFNNQWVKMTK